MCIAKLWHASLVVGVACLPMGSTPGAGVPTVSAGKEEKPELKVAPVLQESKSVVEKGLAFQLLASPVWPGPEADGVSPVGWQLRATNGGSGEILYVPFRGMPVLKSASGEVLKAQCHGADHILRRPDPVSLKQDKSATAKQYAQLFARPNGFTLLWEDDGGSVWTYDGLKPGKYLLSVHYKTTAKLGEWSGEAQTAAVPVEIRELKSSRPTAANQLEFCGLANAIWPAPAPGASSVVQLGFRVNNVQGPNWAAIIPCITAVQIQTADGRHLPAKKTATGQHGRTPQWLHLKPGLSQSLTEPASLSRTGKSLVLSWADSAGDVWQIDDLHPGRYTLRFMIQALSGKTPGDWTTWTGEVHTATLDVEITD